MFTDPTSFNAVDQWIEDIRAERGDDVVIVLVGNKVDLQVKTNFLKKICYHMFYRIRERSQLKKVKKKPEKWKSFLLKPQQRQDTMLNKLIHA